MKLLSIDPGETVGLVYLSRDRDGEDVTLEGFLDTPLRFLKKNLPVILAAVDEVAIEDYRVFASHAGHHIGARLITSELIGFVEAHCDLKNIRVIRIAPNKKGRWPEARLRAKHPEFKHVTGHARDALKLGLAYLEKEEV